MKFYKLIGAQPTKETLQKASLPKVTSCFAGHEDEIANALTKGVGYVDGSLLGSILFPEVQNKIFISHDHAEEQKANYVAHLLGTERCFIDKQIWASADKILINLQRKVIPRNENGTFPMDGLNALASHFYGMLSNAIQTTIAHSRAFLYIPSSHTEIHNGMMYQRSPWINFELLQAKSVYELLNPGILKESALRHGDISNQMKLLYQVDDSFMKDVDLEHLKNSLRVL